MQFEKIKILKEKTIEYNSQTITNALQIVQFISNIENMQNLTDESVYVICLNSKNRIVAYSEIAKGGTNFCNLDVKTIFKTILLCNATKFILTHNHPSGDPTPSNEDYKITKELKNKAKLLDIQLLDHIVIGENNTYCSCMQ